MARIKQELEEQKTQNRDLKIRYCEISAARDKAQLERDAAQTQLAKMNSLPKEVDSDEKIKPEPEKDSPIVISGTANSDANSDAHEGGMRFTWTRLDFRMWRRER